MININKFWFFGVECSIFWLFFAVDSTLAGQSCQLRCHFDLDRSSQKKIASRSNPLNRINYQQIDSTSAQDLLTQQDDITRVTGVQLNQSDKGLEVIFNLNTKI